MSDEDPPRWADSGTSPPPELLALVRDASRPPPLPPVLRASVRASVLRAARPLYLQPPFVAGLVVVAMVVVGAVIWRVVPREHAAALIEKVAPPAVVHRVGASETPEVTMPYPPSTEDAGTASPDAEAPEEEEALEEEAAPRAPAGSGGESPRRSAETDPFRELDAPPRSWARLTLTTTPSTRVFIDGRDTGRDTPVRALRITAGRHRVGFRTADGAMTTIDVELRPGEHQRIVRNGLGGPDRRQNPWW